LGIDLRRLAATILALFLSFVQSSFATDMTVPARIVSINMCTDQLLLDLAKPSQIVGLSPFARDKNLSWFAAKAEGLPLLSGTAEEIMTIKPDLIVADRYTKRATREFIRARGAPLEEFDTVLTLAESRRQILRFGDITGAKQGAAERVAELDAAVAALKAVSLQSGLSILPLSRRGWVTGGRSLVGEILKEAGLRNAADDLGFSNGGFASLETIIALKPDALLISADHHVAEDQGLAMLLHPAIAKAFPPERRIVLPDKLTICGGPMLTEAMKLLTEQLSRMKPR
jgi:iron complex transport system substrate-binding protein